MLSRALTVARQFDLFAPRRPSAPAAYYAHPNTPLLCLQPQDDFRLRDAFEGVQIFGGTGSGKSSGSGKALALAYLRAGFGGLVLCAKPDEAERWCGYVREARRDAHLLVFRPDEPLGFNFLEYELRRPDGAGLDTFNLVNLLLRVVEAAQLAEGPSSGGENPFWQRAMRELLANAVEPLFAATGTLRLDDLMRFVTSAPNSRQEAVSDGWKERSFCYQVLRKSYHQPSGRTLAEHELRASADYWFFTFADLDPKTRSNLVATLTSTISPFLRGMLRDRFCTTTEIIPELTHEGAIIVMDFPVKLWGEAAVVAANILKYQWQRATERRHAHEHARPVFLWADECQFFLSDYDQEFLSTARSSRAATVYITQNLPSYYSRLKTRDAHAAADSLLGNFQTKIFHANMDHTTNQYASNMIGKTLQRRKSRNWSQSGSVQTSETDSSSWGNQYGESEGQSWGSGSNSGGSFGPGGASHTYGNSSQSGGNKGTSWSRSSGGGRSVGHSTTRGDTDGGGWSEQMDFTVEPMAFAARLRKGGAADKRLVDGIVVQGGRRFHWSGAHWLHCTFKQ